MTQQPTFPVAVEETEHLWIPTPDGVRLAARLWRPAIAAPTPALLEIIPYRKRDMVRARDERNHPYFAAHGYACLRVDMRGSGDSDGVMADMYSEAELADTRHVIEWIAAQPWCDGQVGMFGTSWGGTASLQASVDAPPALKAAIAVCATHDRYEDDIHHKGGCLLTDSIEWGATLPAILAAPPDAATVGAEWRGKWLKRLDALAFPLEAWLREEARGAYWRRGSIRRRADALSVPVFCVGGWSDRYSNSVMSLVDARPDLVWGLVGPWGHHYPDVGAPGPAAGFQQIALEWWDHWLKRDDGAALDWPRLRVWLREFDPPADALAQRRGSWIEAAPPSAASARRAFHLASGALRDAPQARGEWLEAPTDLLVGQAGGDTGYFGRFGGLPLDQSEDDARSLVFETPPLTEDVDLFGSAAVSLLVDAKERRSQLALRLCDVSPEGVSCRVGLSLLNLALDETLDAPEAPLASPRTATAAFHTAAYKFRKGHRIRLAISGSYWPTAWPSPGVGAVRIADGVGRLSLPILTEPTRALARPLPPPIEIASDGRTVLSAPSLERRRYESDGAIVTEWRQPTVSVRHHDTDSIFDFETRARHAIDPDDPLSAESLFEHRMVFARPDGVAETRCLVRVTADADAFHADGCAEALWNGETVFEKRWTPATRRRFS